MEVSGPHPPVPVSMVGLAGSGRAGWVLPQGRCRWWSVPPGCLLLNPEAVPALHPHSSAGLGMPCDQRLREWMFGGGRQGLILFPVCLAVSQGAGCTGALRELCEGWGLAGSGLSLLHGTHVPVS